MSCLLTERVKINNRIISRKARKDRKEKNFSELGELGALAGGISESQLTKTQKLPVKSAQFFNCAM